MQRLDDESIVRRAHHHVQMPVFGTQGQHAVGAQELGQKALQFGHHVRKCLALNKRQLQMLRQRMRGVRLRYQPQAHEDPVEGAAHLTLGRQGTLQVARGELAGTDQQVTVLGPTHGANGG